MSAGLELVRLRLAAGSPPGDLDDLPDDARTFLDVAVTAGAPLLDALDAACAVEDDRRRAARAVEVAAAQGRAVVTGLSLAPLLLIPFLGSLFDVDLVAYHRTPLGMVTGGLGLALLAVGAAGARAAVARVGRPPQPARPAVRRVVAVVLGAGLAALAHPAVGAVIAVVLWRRPSAEVATDPDVADAAELTAVGVAGGGSPAAALRVAADALPDLAVPLRRVAFDLERGHRGDPPSDVPGLSRLTDVLTTADAVGAPVGPTLRRFAADVRADELARVLADAERLPVQLTFPTALASLPGVLLLIGAPIVHGALAVAP